MARGNRIWGRRLQRSTLIHYQCATTRTWRVVTRHCSGLCDAMRLAIYWRSPIVSSGMKSKGRKEKILTFFLFHPLASLWWWWHDKASPADSNCTRIDHHRCWRQVLWRFCPASRKKKKKMRRREAQAVVRFVYRIEEEGPWNRRLMACTNKTSVNDGSMCLFGIIAHCFYWWRCFYCCWSCRRISQEENCTRWATFFLQKFWKHSMAN